MIRPVQMELYAVVGNPVAHSLSPPMMNAAFRALGHPSVYVALELDSPLADLTVLDRVGFKGLSVTLPHKESAFQWVKRVDETARAIGAVNTLKRTREGWAGCNTDWIGSNRALQSATGLKGRKGLVIGAGGAARAVVYGLKREGVDVTICNRGEERGASLARHFDCAFIPLRDLSQALTRLEFHLVVQCTPVGLGGDQAGPFTSERLFRPGMVVMDTVYRPLHTPFVKQAMNAGCTVVSGLEMLLHQGVEQIKFWLDLAAIPDRVIEEMRETLYRAVNPDE